ncbi:hypothetical protein M422DRAFT_31268, partial [Sphaerobolus stellatus SS14]
MINTISSGLFKLPKEEHKYWHSHKYEASVLIISRNVTFKVLQVESGLLRLDLKSGVPGEL